MSRHRLFVALRPPREVRTYLLGWMGGVPGARWQDDEQLHCTVRFIGEVDRMVAEDVAQALLTLRHPVIDAALDGVGTFGKAGRVDTIWTGIAPISALAPLHAKVERLVVACGVPRDPRAYRPHITVARLSRSAAIGPGIVAGLAPPERLPVRFHDIRLCESVLARDGARYETIARYPLS